MMQARTWCLALLVMFGSSGSVAAHRPVFPLQAQAASAKNPLAGSWVANIAKSKRHPNHLFKSATLEVHVVGEAVTITHAGVNAAGKQESGTVVLQADGREHPVPGQSEIVTITKWRHSRRLETVARKAGAIVGRQLYEVSRDGKTLTATVSGTDAVGAVFEQVILFDRK